MTTATRTMPGSGISDTSQRLAVGLQEIETLGLSA